MSTRRGIDRSSTGRPRGIAVVAVVVALQTVLHLLNRTIWRTPALDVNAEGTVFVAVAGASIALVSAGALLVARREHGGLRRRALLLAVLLAGLALDEVVAIHERFGVRAAALLGLSEDWDSVLWPLVYLPLLTTVVVLLLGLSHLLDAPGRRLLGLGLVLLATAVALEVLSAPFSTATTGGGLVHHLEGGLEEALELAGWGLLAVALLTAGRGAAQADRVGPLVLRDRRLQRLPVEADPSPAGRSSRGGPEGTAAGA